MQIQADQLFPNIAEAYSETSALSYTREKERERTGERTEHSGGGRETERQTERKGDRLRLCEGEGVRV